MAKAFSFWRYLVPAILLSHFLAAPSGVPAAMPSDGGVADAVPSNENVPASVSAKAGSLAIQADEFKAAARLTERVTIFRDAFGVPHVDGADDESVVFGLAYAQAEDYFWQIEDTYILGLGRYSEVHGPSGLNSDLLNRAFEIVPRSQQVFSQLDPKIRLLCGAFSAGLNYYLARHPEVRPRLITHFEPWHVVTFGRHLLLELCFRRTGLSNTYMPRSHELIWPATGSNAWAIAPSRTSSGHAMLMVNPHMPWFGFGQMYAAHLRSGEGWNFTGAMMYGNPVPSMGHNEDLGWAMTTNEPDIADLWRVTFDDPHEPLNYRYGDGFRRATEWSETIKVSAGAGVSERRYTFRKTHHGPIVAKEDEQHYLAARISGLFNKLLMAQSLAMMRSRNLGDFRAALEMQQFPLMNILYADRAGNIFYLYNGSIPRRDSQFDWTKPVDGADPRCEWGDVLKLDELPQVLNPAAGYVQNCNSSPLTTAEGIGLRLEQFPHYLAEDWRDDKRRAKMSRQLLGNMQQAKIDDVVTAAFDTTVYWAQQELPRYGKRWNLLEANKPELAARVKPYLDHLLDWDCRITADSTQATLCEAWYEELHGNASPAEEPLPKFIEQPELEFESLVAAAEKLAATHGDWHVPWGDLFRVQRQPNTADLLELPFDDRAPSLPSLGGPGSMGVVFTEYYSPTLVIPGIVSLKKRYGLIGTTYLAVYEFGEHVTGMAAVNFGESGDPKSPHFTDQAQLLAKKQLKPELFQWDDVAKKAVLVYRPGEAKSPNGVRLPAPDRP